jgi:hypothetical protein
MYQEGFTFSDFATDQAFTLTLGGRYLWSAKATWGGGSLALQALGPDGSTYLDVYALESGTAEKTATLTADGAALIDLAPGSYRLHPATATAISASIVRVPLA